MEQIKRRLCTSRLYIWRFTAVLCAFLFTCYYLFDSGTLDKTADLGYNQYNINRTRTGYGCEIPYLNPFAPEIMKFDKKLHNIVCRGRDWVKCYLSKCTIDTELIEIVRDGIECTYEDIIYESDDMHYYGPPKTLKGNKEYVLKRSDRVRIKCKLDTYIQNKYYDGITWSGFGVGYRPIKPENPPPGRENTVNVMILGFDSTAKNGFIRKMPRSYKYLAQELTILNGYNVFGDGTPAALFPLLTGKTEGELQESRGSIPDRGYLDDMPWIFNKLKKDGYRTAYFEDMPKIGTFQYRFKGFRHQPTDHYLRAFYIEADQAAIDNHNYYCIGDTPRYKLMMNLTDQFMQLDGKRYVFTFISDICHNNFNLITNADEAFVQFLSKLKNYGIFKDTLLVVMGDHGPRYADVRATQQGMMEERLPLMAIRLPDDFKSTRPETFKKLRSNSYTLTTINDVYATILDVIDMKQHWNNYKVQGTAYARGLTLLETIPKNRTCIEAGIEPHWCICLAWEPLKPNNTMYEPVAKALLDHINEITQFHRSKCVLRTLTSIDWVKKEPGVPGSVIPLAKDLYQVKITVGPGIGVYEGTITHLVKEDKFSVNTREISRINAYNNEPECVLAEYPNLMKFCYCDSSK